MPPVTAIGTPFIQLNQVDSTNNYAMGQAQAHLAAHGTAWLAWEQNKGKGQRGKAWESPPGSNILLSILLEPAGLGVDDQFYISMISALAAHDLFSAYSAGDTTLKWPNDLYWRDRKAGGILIENLWQGKDWKYSVVGIGININQAKFDSSLPNPVSLRQVTGREYDVVELAKLLCQQLEHWWQVLQASDRQIILETYNERLYKLGQQVSFKMDNAQLDAIVTGVNAKGELVVDTGESTHLPFGSVEWIIG